MRMCNYCKCELEPKDGESGVCSSCSRCGYDEPVDTCSGCGSIELQWFDADTYLCHSCGCHETEPPVPQDECRGCGSSELQWLDAETYVCHSCGDSVKVFDVPKFAEDFSEQLIVALGVDNMVLAEKAEFCRKDKKTVIFNEGFPETLEYISSMWGYGLAWEDGFFVLEDFHNTEKVRKITVKNAMFNDVVVVKNYVLRFGDTTRFCIALSYTMTTVVIIGRGNGIFEMLCYIDPVGIMPPPEVAKDHMDVLAGMERLAVRYDQKTATRMSERNGGDLFDSIVKIGIFYRFMSFEKRKNQAHVAQWVRGLDEGVMKRAIELFRHQADMILEDFEQTRKYFDEVDAENFSLLRLDLSCATSVLSLRAPEEAKQIEEWLIPLDEYLEKYNKEKQA